MTFSSQVSIDHSRRFTKFFIAEKNRKIHHLVFHHITAKDPDEAIELLLLHEVSAHFLVDEMGKIFCLVDEKNVAFHAGVSFWRGYDGLNPTSIGIEFINPSPFSRKFNKVQMQAGVELSKFLVKKYQIEPFNIVGHSDIAYHKNTSFLDRKQDPSHLFDWSFFAENGVGIAPNLSEIKIAEKSNRPFIFRILFIFGDASNEIMQIKILLKNFGYLVRNLNNEFDEEMRYLVRVFNRRFLSQSYEFDSDLWYLGSQLCLEAIKNFS